MSIPNRLFDTVRDRRTPTAQPAAPLSPEVAANLSLSCYLPLVQKFAAMRRELGGGIIAAFSSISKGEGVTFVTESLAWVLAKQTGEQVLLTTPGGLASAACSQFREKTWPVFHPVRRLTGAGGKEGELRELGADDLLGLRQRFGFVLVDCPAMRESSQALAVSRLCDGIVLVVAAGQSKRGEIEYAQSALQASSASILGLVLNKRVDPVPPFVSRYL